MSHTRHTLMYTAACPERHSQGKGSYSDTTLSQLRVSTGPFIIPVHCVHWLLHVHLLDRVHTEEVGHRLCQMMELNCSLFAGTASISPLKCTCMTCLLASEGPEMAPDYSYCKTCTVE